MDRNKKAKLDEIGYKIHPSCGLCVFGEIRDGNLWGLCLIKSYEHEKHTERFRLMSVHRHGYCDDFEINPDLDRFGGFQGYWEAGCFK